MEKSARYPSYEEIASLKNCARTRLPASELVGHVQKLSKLAESAMASVDFVSIKTLLDVEQLEIRLSFVKRVNALAFLGSLVKLEDECDHHCESVSISYRSFVLVLQTHEQDPVRFPGVKDPCVSHLDIAFAQLVLSLVE
jgi:pterin-4a-carbinolamine dehydratase